MIHVIYGAEQWISILSLQLGSQTSELRLVFIIGKLVNYNLIFMSILNNYLSLLYRDQYK